MVRLGWILCVCRTAARALGPRRIAAHVVTSSREPPSAKMPPGFDQVGLVMGERTPQTRTSKTATAKAFCELVRGKIVVVDVPCLLYSLLLRKPGLAHLILSVDPTSSVYYEVCRLMSAWFRSQLLFHAKALVFISTSEAASIATRAAGCTTSTSPSSTASLAAPRSRPRPLRKPPSGLRSPEVS